MIKTNILTTLGEGLLVADGIGGTELSEIMVQAPPKPPCQGQSKPRLIYVAGALSGAQPGDNPNRSPSTVVCDYIRNVSNMCWIAGRLRQKGYYPYVPGADLLLGLVGGNWNEAMYRDMSMAFLEVCDAVLVTSRSSGVEREIGWARELDIPIYYTMEELEAVR